MSRQKESPSDSRDPGIHRPRHVSQIDLIAAIAKHLDRHHGFKAAIPRQFNAMIAAANLVVEEFEKPFIPAPAGCGWDGWWASDDRGASSEFMAIAIASAIGMLVGAYGNVHSRANNHPHDGDDFGRCVTLLNAVPRLREHLSEMAKRGAVWAALVERWGELEADPSLVAEVVRNAEGGK